MQRRFGKNKDRWTCRSGKVRFRDEQSAGAALRVIKGRNTREKVPIRAYECPLCKGWHLTSQES